MQTLVKAIDARPSERRAALRRRRGGRNTSFARFRFWGIEGGNGNRVELWLRRSAGVDAVRHGPWLVYQLSMVAPGCWEIGLNVPPGCWRFRYYVASGGSLIYYQPMDTLHQRMDGLDAIVCLPWDRKRKATAKAKTPAAAEQAELVASQGERR